MLWLIIPGEHHPVQQVDHSEDVAWVQVCRSALDLTCVLRNVEVSRVGVYLQSIDDIQDQIAGHDFSQ